MTSTQLRASVTALACTLFVVTTSEFQVAAMLTDMSRDLGAAVADLTLLVTVYSLGMSFGGPAVSVALRRTPPRGALIGIVFTYAVVETAAGLMPNLAGVAACRLVTGALSGAAFGLALTTGMATSPAEDRGRAASHILAGLMAGTLLGLPLSHLLASWTGWRISFFVLAAGAVVMAVALTLLVPPVAPERRVKDHGSALAGARVWLRFATSFLTVGGAFAAFALIDPLLREAGLPTGAATLTMIAFGAAGFLCNHLSGRVTQGGGYRWLLAALALQLVALTMVMTHAHNASTANPPTSGRACTPSTT